MAERKEDIYTGYSQSNPQPLQDPPQYAAKPASQYTVNESPMQNAQPQYAAQPYASQRAQQAPFVPQNEQQQPYGQQAPYGQPAPYGQQPNYGAPVQGYPYAPGQPPKKSSAGKIIAIVIGCIVGLCVLLFIAIGVMAPSAEDKVEDYRQSGNLADLIDACDLYDDDISYDTLEDPIAAENCFAEALADTKVFLRAFGSAECVDYYEDADAAYVIMMSDYLYLMLKNGHYDEYVSVFTKKMLEYSPTGSYYLDTYTLQDYIEKERITLNDEQKQVIVQGFETLVDASATEYEKEINLQEFYDVCETLGLYDKADEIEAQLAVLHGETDAAA